MTRTPASAMRTTASRAMGGADGSDDNEERLFLALRLGQLFHDAKWLK